MLKKILVIGLVAILLFVGIGYYYVFVYSVQHHRDVTKEVGIQVSATALSNAFLTNEQVANKTYLNKVIEVRGAVLNVAQDQTGHKTVLLGSEMELANTFITLKDTSVQIKIGDTILVKAICNGFLSDVVLVEGVVFH